MVQNLKLAFLIFISILSSVLLVSAADPNIEHYGKAGETLLVTRPCTYVNGTTCAVSVACNSSVQYFSSGQFFIFNQNETRLSNGMYSYAFPNTTTIAVYRADRTCQDASASATETYYIQVTPTGDNRTVSFALMLGLCSFLLFFLAIYARTPILGIISGMAFMVTGVYIMINGFSNFADDYTRYLGMISLGFGFILFLVGSWELSSFSNKEEEGEED